MANGGIVGKDNPTSISLASGVFTLQEHFIKKSVNSWPITIPSGQREYTTSGSYSWTAPTNVYAVSVVCVGAGGGGGATGGSGGGGGGGGGLGYKNNILVTPGTSYTVVVGAGGSGDGGDSYFISTSDVCGFGGSGGSGATGGTGGNYTGEGGGNGGSPDNSGISDSTGGGGAGGYSGNGGGSSINQNGADGAGGGGGGGAAGGSSDAAGGGGGVGIYGEGTSGSGGAYDGSNGGGGSGGSSGSAGGNGSDSSATNTGGAYGGGGGGSELSGENGAGAGGAVRIMWGTGRAYPSTNTASVSMDYEANYSSYLSNTVTTIPSTEAGSTYNADIIFAIDGNFASVDDGTWVEYGGTLEGFSIGCDGQVLRARAYDASVAFNTSGTTQASVEADISSYSGSQATYYAVLDSSLSTLTVYVQPGGRNSTSQLVELGSGTRTSGTSDFCGSGGRGYGQINSGGAPLGSGWDTTFQGTIDEIRVYGDNSSDFVENFGQ